MKIEKFTGESTSVVMQQVREAFGRDAVIISNRTTDSGVEIVATDDLEALETALPEGGTPSGNKRRKGAAKPAAVKRTTGKANSAGATAKTTASKRSKTTSDGNRKKKVVASVEEAVKVAALDDFDGAATEEVQNQLGELRHMLEGLARGGTLAGAGGTAELTLTSRLMGIGLGVAVARQLVEAVGPVIRVDKAWEQALDRLSALLPVHKTVSGESSDLLDKGGTVIFHGRAGVGKTTVLCKLAAEYLAKGTPSKLAIISHRSGPFRVSRGRLESFAEVLRVPVHYTETEHELHEALRGFRRKSLVLVDTDAMTDAILAEPGELPGGGILRRNIEHCVVVPANLQSSAIDFQLGCLAESAIESVVLNRLDETRQPGIVVESLIRAGLKIRFCSDNAVLHRPLSTDVVDQVFQKISNLDAQPRRGLTGAVSVSELAGISALEPATQSKDLQSG